MFLESVDRMLNFLSVHWLVGAISGFGTWALLNVNNFFTSPENLEFVKIFGAWGGGMICGITLLLKLIEFAEKMASKFKKS